MTPHNGPETETDPRLRWLKPLVIGLSAVFVILMLALIVGFITGAPGRRTEAVPAARPGQMQSLSLPGGARIVEILPAGDAVILRLRLADGSEQLHSLNARSLSPQGSLLLQTDR